MSWDGALRFGRYAFPPNRFGYCGPPDYQALLEHVAAGEAGPGLVEMERRFEGAYPYLELIAHANGIADPFDERVVEAYWIGNSLLGRVSPATFADSLARRFQPRIERASFGWLAAKPAVGAVPHHNFHVFEVFTRAGFLTGERSGPVLEVMDSCRISWGMVIAAEGADLLVDRATLEIGDGRLRLSSPRPTRVQRQLGGVGFGADLAPGQWVSVHWNWACESLDPKALARLRGVTRRSLVIANQTI